MLILVLFSTSFANSADEPTPLFPHSCCIPTSDDSPKKADPNFAELNDCSAFDDNEYYFVENCFRLDVNNEPVWAPGLTATSCCCANEVIVPAPGTSFVYEYSCTQQGGELIYPKPLDASQCLSNLCFDDGSTPEPVTYDISGKIFWNSTTNIPLEGANIKITHLIDKSAFTDDEGNYYLTEIRNGTHTYTIDANQITVPGYDVPINCYPVLNGQLTVTQTSTNTNFYLTCGEQGVECVPQWGEVVWSTCQPVGNGIIGQQYGTVIDENDCGIPYNESLVKDCVLTTPATCGDGIVNEGEECDGTNFSLGTGTTDTLLCSDLQFGNDAAVTCTDWCTYDTSACFQVCPNFCGGTPWECEYCLDLCGGNPACSEDCSVQYPVFVAEDITVYQFGDEGDGSIDDPLENISQLYANIAYAFDNNKAPFPAIQFFEGTKDVELNWYYDDSCASKVQYYTVSACELTQTVNGLVCNSELKRTETATTTNHIFKDLLEPQKSYCFNVCVKTSDSEEPICAFDDSIESGLYSQGFCIQTPQNDYCMTPHGGGRNCYDDQNVGCEYYDSNSNYPTLLVDSNTCTGGTFCVETTTGAMCKEKLPCEKCNGLFGLFSDNNFNVKAYTLSYEEIDFNCLANQFSGSTTPTADNLIGICYKDEQVTLAPKFQACEAVDSCYSYESEYACNNDPCYKFQNESDKCEWNYYDEELGIGVCRPQNEEQQNCVLCDTDSPLGFCDETMCQDVYGECYYVENGTFSSPFALVLGQSIGDRGSPLIPTCVAKRDTSCYLYNNEEDCIGHKRVRTNTSIDLDRLSWTGNNARTPSKDFFSLGVCKWDSENNYCFKDSDDFFPIPNEDSNTLKAKDDCEYLKDADNLDLTKICLIDTIPPNTTISFRGDNIYWNNEDIPIYGKNELKYIAFLIDENFMHPEILPHLTTYVSFEKIEEVLYASGNMPSGLDGGLVGDLTPPGPEPDPVISYYPNETLPNMEVSKFDNYEGEVILRYFSQDFAKNMEVVKIERIYVDGIPPSIIRFDSEINTYISNNDKYLSNLSLIFNTNEEAKCNATLRLNPSTVELPVFTDWDIEGVTAQEFEREYTNLPDGNYVYTITCEDLFKNEAVREEIISIEGDKSIYGADTQGEIYNTIEDIELSINTMHPATCRFDVLIDGELPTYNLSEGNFITDSTKTFHSIDFVDALAQLSLDNVPLSKSYVFYTSCKFDDVTLGTTEQDYMDAISLTIDRLPPKTYVWEVINSEKKIYSDDAFLFPWKDKRVLQIECNDQQPESFNWYGCKEIYYCLTKEDFEYDDSMNYEITNNEICNSSRFNKSEFEDQDYLELSLNENNCKNCNIAYYVVDNGENKPNDLTIVNPKIRDLDFGPPQLIIQGPGADPIVIEQDMMP